MMSNTAAKVLIVVIMVKTDLQACVMKEPWAPPLGKIHGVREDVFLKKLTPVRVTE